MCGSLPQHGSLNIKIQTYAQIPPKVEYSLSEKGQTLWPIIQEMCQWGEHNQVK
ncbi:winged helix-turn-helix transcriptional regulator [Cytobacillus gottheilii]|uniref:winged helix-turn-helix transcriptional regulator n=1 Tax=Cytobacillus gottheilii TaxID=859144 RepID=UPI003CE68793